jgi:anti-sigma factor RsiW
MTTPLQGRPTMLSRGAPTDCMRARESASAQLDGELPEFEAARLHAHLCACGECAAYAREIGGIVREFRAAPLVPLRQAIEVPRMLAGPSTRSGT